VSARDDTVSLTGILVGPERFAWKLALETMAESAKRGSALAAMTGGKVGGLILITSMTIRTDMQVQRPGVHRVPRASGESWTCRSAWHTCPSPAPWAAARRLPASRSARCPTSGATSHDALPRGPLVGIGRSATASEGFRCDADVADQWPAALHRPDQRCCWLKFTVPTGPDAALLNADPTAPVSTSDDELQHGRAPTTEQNPRCGWPLFKAAALWQPSRPPLGAQRAPAQFG